MGLRWRGFNRNRHGYGSLERAAGAEEKGSGLQPDTTAAFSDTRVAEPGPGKMTKFSSSYFGAKAPVGIPTYGLGDRPRF